MHRTPVTLRLIFCLIPALHTACSQSAGVSGHDREPAKDVSIHMAQRGAGSAEPVAVSTSQPAAPTRPAGRPIATLNDKPIGRSEFVRMLIDAHGLQLMQLVLVREAARQEASKQGIAITPADIEREYDITAHAEHLNGKDVEALTPARREQIIEEWTRSRGVSRVELTVAMEKQAILRKIATPLVAEKKIDDARIEREFQRTYGERVEIRHIQFDNPRVAVQIQERLANGESFEQLVADYSQNSLTKIRQGLMPAFSEKDDSVPPILAAAAFQLEPGKVSNPIEVEGYYHILKLERRIPAESITIDEVRDKLDRTLRGRMIDAKMEELGRRLLLGSTLKIEDTRLREQYNAAQRAGRLEGPPLIGQ